MAKPEVGGGRAGGGREGHKWRQEWSSSSERRWMR